MADATTPGATDRPPVTIIAGTGRSGSVYLGRLLKRTFDIGISGEPKFVVPAERVARRQGDLAQPEDLERFVTWLHGDIEPIHHLRDTVGIHTEPRDLLDRVDEPSYTGVLYGYLRLMADMRGQTELGFRDPSALTRLPDLLRLLPTARIVHVLRDGRDVAGSYLKFDWGPSNLHTGSRHWVKEVGAARRAEPELGDRYHRVRLEDLVLEPEDTSRRLGRFLGDATGGDRTRQLVDAVVETRDESVVEAWRRTLKPREVLDCEAVMGPELTEHGYVLTGGDGTGPGLPRRTALVASDLAVRGGRKVRRTIRRARRG